jgi:putative SOS response-associated peptidase YedK
MCGRYVFTSPLEAIQQMFKFDQMPNLGPNFNVAPTHEMPIVRRRKGDRRNELAIARWGLIPHWAKDAKIAYSTINARSETAATKPAFREAFKSRRALIPADGYFEWVRDGKEKQPHLIRFKDGGPFAFAGLWSTWQSPEGEVTSYTIMTTEPNELMAEIHSRMPVILGEDDHDRWLDLDADPGDVLKPCPTDWLETYPVDKRVGNVRNNDAGLIEPLPQ